ncbi:MAG: IS1 family transposase [Theionarchaea archaeon]|nr:IS1 family transposase [Theionarchaea archaeon]
MRGRKRSFEKYPPCDRCNNSAHVVGYGKRSNKTAEKQTYFCKKCHHKFTPDDGFKGVRFSPDIIIQAVSLSEKGYTLKEVVKEIEHRYDVRVGESTVHDWTKKYTPSGSKRTINP